MTDYKALYSHADLNVFHNIQKKSTIVVFIAQLNLLQSASVKQKVLGRQHELCVQFHALAR